MKEQATSLKDQAIKLTRKNGRVLLNGEAVRLLWARPISGRGQEISILSEKNEELAFLENLQCLDEDSQKIANEELQSRYLISRIEKVIEASSVFGKRVVKAQTNRGLISFAIKNPNHTIVHLPKDRVVIKCAIGNRYEILSLSALDERSRGEIEKVI